MLLARLCRLVRILRSAIANLFFLFLGYTIKSFAEAACFAPSVVQISQQPLMSQPLNYYYYSFPNYYHEISVMLLDAAIFLVLLVPAFPSQVSVSPSLLTSLALSFKPVPVAL
jgi:hypothetical protein